METVRRTLRDANRRTPLKVDISKRKFEAVQASPRADAPPSPRQCADVVSTDNRFDAEDLPRLLSSPARGASSRPRACSSLWTARRRWMMWAGWISFKGWLRQRARAMTDEGAKEAGAAAAAACCFWACRARASRWPPRVSRRRGDACWSASDAGAASTTATSARASAASARRWNRPSPCRRSCSGSTRSKRPSPPPPARRPTAGSRRMLGRS